MKDLSVKKTPLWGKIAVTLFALLTFGAVVGYVVSLICDWFVMPTFAAVFKIINGSLTERVWRNLWSRDSLGIAGLLQFAFGLDYNVAQIVTVLEVIHVNLWRCISVCGNLLVAVPCLLLPIHTWLLSKKRWGGIVVVAAFLLSGLGFLTLSACFFVNTLEEAIVEGVHGWMTSPVLEKVILIVLRKMALGVIGTGVEIPLLCVAFGMFLMAVLAIFGRHSKVFSLLDLGASAGILSIPVVVLTIECIDHLRSRWGHYTIMLERYYNYEIGSVIEQYIFDILHNNSRIGTHITNLNSMAICAGVLLTALVFVISTKMPALFGKKKS